MQVTRWDWITVGIVRGIPQGLGDTLLEFFGDYMLQAIRLFVYLVPVVAQHLVEIHFEQAVMAQYLEGYLFTLGRQDYTTMLLIFQQWRGGL